MTTGIQKYRLQGPRCLHCNREGHTVLVCPRRPCYICRERGHLSTNCKYRMRPGSHVEAWQRHLKGRKLESRPFYFCRAREVGIVQHRAVLELKNPMLRSGADTKVDKVLESPVPKRITALEFHPTENGILFAGDKAGHLLMYNYARKLSGAQSHSVCIKHASMCNINAIVFDETGRFLYTSSACGMVQKYCIDRGKKEKASYEPTSFQYDANMEREGWRMMYGLDYDRNGRKGLYAGDDKGYLHMIDTRAPVEDAMEARIHKQKIQHIHINPLNPNLMVTSSNDRFVKVWDTRNICSGSELAACKHDRAVNSAYFSPNTGLKLLTTAQDNRLRVWFDVRAFGTAENGVVEPSQNIVHSHDFFRYLSPFKAVWDPTDWRDDLFMCGRRLGEKFDSDVELYPLDFFSATAGSLVSTLTDDRVLTICPINKFAPREYAIATGTSRNIFIWRPAALAWDEPAKEDRTVPTRRSSRVWVKRKRKKLG